MKMKFTLTSKFLLYSIILYLDYTLLCQCSNILLVAPFGSKSHSLACHQVGEALTERGHEVHQIVASKLKNDSKVKFLEIPKTAEKLWQEFQLYPYGQHNLNQFPVIWFKYMRALIKACKVFWNEKVVLDLINTNFTYDAILMDSLLQECALPLVHNLGVPVVFMSANLLDPNTAWYQSVPTSYAHVPSFFAEVNRPMTFKQRIMNSIAHLSYVILHKWYYLSAIKKIASSKIHNLPDLTDIVANISGVMATADKGIILPSRPMMNNFIDITGITTKPAKPLPASLETLINSSGDNGFILFSLGTIVESDHFPPHVLESFLNAFSKLDQLVVLKHRGDSSNFPPNVKALDWLPQNDLLGHPKIRLFITHGGMHGLYETIYHGVPIVGIGIYTDQRPNMIRSVERGFAVEIHEDEITTDTVYDAIMKILNDSIYKQTAMNLSNILRDEPETPMDRAINFLEYVIRHKGSQHLHSTGADLSLVHYFNVDVLVFLFILICFLMWVIHRIFQHLFHLYRKVNLDWLRISKYMYSYVKN